MTVTSVYERVHKLCADYECGGAGELSFETTEADIAAEAAQSENNNHNPAYLEELAVYRKIAEAMPAYGTFLMHGSVIAVDGNAYMFAAPSGTGKSTHARLWREYLGERAVMVNDDKPLLHVENGEVTAYGTPWNGKHHLGANISAPLKGICFLSRGETNSIEPASKSEVYGSLLMQTYRPSDPAAMKLTLSLLDKLTEIVPLYKLRCNMDISAAKTACGFLLK